MKKIHELKTTCSDGSVRYIYFAKLGGKWTDLAPWGNRIP
jgi:hypothetical protein